MTEAKLNKEQIEELLCRFILNLPQSEFQADRFFFNMQKAYWFYKDFMMKEHEKWISMKKFSRILYKSIPFDYDIDTFDRYHKTFLKYIQQIPVYGAIILNSNLDKVLLVTNFSNKYYGFPKGKINEGEDGLSCAVREVWEEIGIDISGLISEDNVITNNVKNESKTLYVVVGVNESFIFNANHMTRKEIGRIEWMKISELEFHKELDKYLLVKPFINPLKLFIQRYKEKMTQKSQMSEKSEEKLIKKIKEEINIDANEVEDTKSLDGGGSKSKTSNANINELDGSDLALKKVTSTISARDLEKKMKKTHILKSPVFNQNDIPHPKEGKKNDETVIKKFVVNEEQENREFISRVNERVKIFSEELEEKMNSFNYKEEINKECPTPGKLKNPFSTPFRINVQDLEAQFLKEM